TFDPISVEVKISQAQGRCSDFAKEVRILSEVRFYQRGSDFVKE
ncbi:11733_t:CDS:2, partial [Dentiscutata erythropus]